MNRVGVDHLVGVDIRRTHAIRSQLILAIGRRPGAFLGLNRLGLLRITEKRDGEAAVGLEVVVPGQELALAAFCAQAFPLADEGRVVGGLVGGAATEGGGQDDESQGKIPFHVVLPYMSAFVARTRSGLILIDADGSLKRPFIPGTADDEWHVATTHRPFPVIQRMGFAGFGWLKRGRAEKTRAVAKIVRIQGFTEACQSL